MNEKIAGFFSHYPKAIKKLLRFLAKYDLELYLVGGSVRDFVDSDHFGYDHDFEIQSSKKMTGVQWEAHIDEVMRRAAEEFGLPIERLKFHIHRLKYEDFDLEFAPAREELYSDKQKVFGHSDFKVSLLVQAPVEKSWRRRDFTLNAMGIYFDLSGPRSKAKFLDPYRGLEDLKSRTLRPVSEDFHKDPVRFVRSLRFSRKLAMKFGRDLKEKLSQFSLELLSFEALRREALKDPAPVEFLVNFFELVEDFKVRLPAQMSDLKSSISELKNLDLKRMQAPQLYAVLDLFWQQNLDWNESEFLAFTLFWGGKKKEALRVYKIYQIINDFPDELFKFKSSQELRRHPYYGQLKKLVEFFESPSWTPLAAVVPSSCEIAGIKKMDPQEFQAQAKKKLQSYKGAERGDQKLLCFLELLKDSNDSTI